MPFCTIIADSFSEVSYSRVSMSEYESVRGDYIAAPRKHCIALKGSGQTPAMLSEQVQ